MRSIGHLALRIAVLGYAALLIVGAWPFHAVPVVGPAAAFATRILGAVTLRPGMEIFNAGEPATVEWKLSALCHRLVGIRSDGKEEVLYARPCPGAGFRSGTDYFELMMQRLTRSTDERELLAREQGEVDHRLRGVQNFMALGDFACRAGGEGRASYRRAQLVQQRRLQSYETGAYRGSELLRCTWFCDERPVPRPVCDRLPSDAPLALVRGDAS